MKAGSGAEDWSAGYGARLLGWVVGSRWVFSGEAAVCSHPEVAARDGPPNYQPERRRD